MTEIRCYDYVNHPYAQVRDALEKDAGRLFQEATKAAASRAEMVAAALHVDLGGIGLDADIHISVKSIEETISDVMSVPVTKLKIEWEAAKMARLFPLMSAEISVYRLTSTETQLDFWGLYEPPLGVLGKAMNAIVGHRLAEASVHRFLGDVADYLRKSLT